MSDTLVEVKRAVHKVDMNAHLADNAAVMGAAVELFDAMPISVQRATVASLRDAHAAFRPLFGLAANRVDLTSYFDPEGMGKKGSSNAKIGKNVTSTLSLTLQSAGACKFVQDGRTVILNTCRWAGLCAPLCVLSHGRGKFHSVIAGRNWRTYVLWADPVGFAIVLRWEMRQAERHGKFLARLNVNSDLPWYLIPALFSNVDMQAYDYTKRPEVLESGNGWAFPNYRLIYSVSERSDMDAVQRFLRRGGSVAVVTNRGKKAPILPTISIAGRRFPIEDGDKTDDRYSTPRGTVVDLYAKGKAYKRKSAFVRAWY